MKNLKPNLLAVIIAIVTTTSCNPTRDENRVVLQGKTDSLLIVSIPDAACGKCQAVIEDGLANQNGVKQSVLNLKTKEVSIVYDPLIVTPQILKTSVTELSYKMPCSRNNNENN